MNLIKTLSYGGIMKINKEYDSWSVVITLDNKDGTKTKLNHEDLNEYTNEIIQENLHELKNE